VVLVVSTVLAVAVGSALAWTSTTRTVQPRAGDDHGWFGRGLQLPGDALAVSVSQAQVDAVLSARAETFRDRSGVPFRRYSVTRESTSPLDPGSLASGRVQVPVEVASRLPGDRGITKTRGTAAFRFVDGRWRLLGVRLRHPELWDLSRVEVVRGGRQLVLVARQASVDPQVLAEEVDLALRHVDEAWPGAGRGRVVVEVPATADALRRLVGRGGDTLAGVTSLHDDGTGPVVRVRLNPEMFAGIGPLARQILLRHELTHAAQYAGASGPMPAWLTEGTADYVGYLGSGVADSVVASTVLADVRAGRMPESLPTDADFGFTRGEDARRRAYELSWVACRAVVDRFGQDRLFALYRAVQSGEGTLEERQRTAVRQVLHLSPAELTALWQDWLRGHA
jgi:hypothetical protein